jgi:hypothetical protein
MIRGTSDGPFASALAVDLTRRRFVGQSGLWAALVAVATRSLSAAADAQEATPIDPARLQRLLDLSRALCGGGTFDPDRGTLLAQFLAGDPDLAAGLDDLLASPPTEGASLGSARAQTTAQAILIYWYVGAVDSNPVPDRSTAYYRLTAWQAMYTPPWAVCKAFGAWTEPPRTDPLVAGN